jgi:hypothetical protein
MHFQFLTLFFPTLFFTGASLTGCASSSYTSEEDRYFSVSVGESEACPAHESVREQLSTSTEWSIVDSEYLSRATYRDRQSKVCLYRFEATEQDEISRTEVCATRPTQDSIRMGYASERFQRSREPREINLQGNGRVEPRRDEEIEIGPPAPVSQECAQGLPVAVESLSFVQQCRSVGDVAPQLTWNWKNQERRIVEVAASARDSQGWAECRYRIAREVEVSGFGSLKYGL